MLKCVISLPNVERILQMNFAAAFDGLFMINSIIWQLLLIWNLVQNELPILLLHSGYGALSGALASNFFASPILRR